MSIETENDFQRLRELSVPTKRAAYSDRMAWMMALLSRIAYESFDEESDKGYHEAFKSAEGEIRKRLELDEVRNLPRCVTGHLPGGALAIVATWYLSSKTLAACYTFGAPRVGNVSLLGWFKTPIYRIVNAADIVPFLPFMKYLPPAIPASGKYPNDFRIQPGISNTDRLFHPLHLDVLRQTARR